MANYDSNYEIAQEISARIGNSPIPFDSVYSICLLIYKELGGVEQNFDSVYSILLEILPLVDGGISSKVIDDNIISTTKTWSSSKINTELNTKASIEYVDEQIEALSGTANSDIEGKQTEDFTFVQSLPVSGEENQLVVIKGDNTDSLYKYVSGEWVEQTPDATKLYFDTENEALYSYVSADHQFAPVSLVNTIIVGSNLNTNTALKAIKTPGVYSVVQRLHSSTKGDYIKNWTLTVEGIDYDEYERTDSIYQRIQSNYTIQKRTWSSTRATNDGWSSFSTYYAGEIKDSTTSKYYTWSSNKISGLFDEKQNILTAGAGIDISNGVISATGGGGSVDMMVEVTYAELKALRDNKQLVPGQQYRITDYVTTTAQANTQSAGHQFDIIVVADSEDKLNENARAIQHSGDTYFANCKLESWELKYCLDNDTDRFAWADTTNGKGIIYHMKDEWNNECPYDFKNIQFQRWEVTAYTNVPSLVVDGEDNYYGYYYGAKDLADNNVLSNATYGSNSGWFYTFALKDLASGEWYDYTVVNSLGLKNDEGNEIVCYGNKIKETKDEYNSGKGEMPIVLNNIVFFNCYTDLSDTNYAEDYSYCYSNTFGNDCYSNTFGNYCRSNTFGNYCRSNTFGNDCYYNTFGNDCYSNTFGNGYNSNTFGNDCYSNTFGNGCNSNTFRNGCRSNTFGNYCYYNTFGNGCNYNTFGNDCYSNTFGNYCYYNTFGNGCRSNTFGNYCYYNTFGNGCNYNTFGNDCYSNTFTTNYNTSQSNKLQYINILSGYSANGAVPSGIVLNVNYSQTVGKNSQGVFTVKNPLD